MSDRRHEDRAVARMPTGATATAAGGRWGAAGAGEVPAAAAAEADGRPPPQDSGFLDCHREAAGAGGGRVAGAAPAAAAVRDLPQDRSAEDGGGGGGGMMPALCGAAAAVASPACPDDERYRFGNGSGRGGAVEGAPDDEEEEERGRKKKKERKKGGPASTPTTGSTTPGSTRSTRRSDLESRLEQVGVGSRVGIYWKRDRTHYPATIIATHGTWPNTYTYLYDDGEQESFDLSTEQFQVLDDAVPEAARAAIAAAARTGGGGDGGGGGGGGGGDDAMPEAARATIGAAQTGGGGGAKNGTAPVAAGRTSTRRTSPRSHSRVGGGGDAANNGDEQGGDRTQSLSEKRSRKAAPKRFDGQEAVAKTASFGDDGDRKPTKKPNRSKAFDQDSSRGSSSSEAVSVGSKDDLTSDELSSLKARQQPEKDLSISADISADRNAHGDDSGEDDEDGHAKEEERWVCHGCGTKNDSGRKRCPAPCRKWKGGSRDAATNSSSSPAKKKNPYANLKRRDSPRTKSKNHCGHCDACMVDECGKCRNCLDMKRFGGPYKIRQKCLIRPACHNPPSKSPTKSSMPKAPASPSGRASGNSRPGRPPRAKAGKSAPPPPPVGSIELDPLPQANKVVVPDRTDCCEWDFNEETRVLLAQFDKNTSIDPGQKESLLKMMERDDITVVSEGLVGGLNQTLWHLDYVKSLVGDKPYHKIRRFERQLTELPADKLKSENDKGGEKIAAGDAEPSTAPTSAAAAAAAATTSVQLEGSAASATASATASSTDQSQRFHVRHKEVDKNLSMKIADYCEYLNKRAVALEKIVEKRRAQGVDPVNPTSQEDDLIGRSTDVEGQNPETFTFFTRDGKEETINVVDEVLYLIDYDMVKLLPPLYEDFVNNFKLPDCLPGGQQCMMNAVNINGRPFMGPNFYVTPPASFTHFHQDGHGTVDSGHTCLSGYNEVVMLRRMPEEHKERALYILNDQKNKKKRSKYDGLYGLPHGDGLGDKPDWPTVDAIEECRRMNYYPSVFVLKPGQFVHINKGRLHAFRKLSPTDLPPNDCHRQLRLGINKELGPKEHICISVAWDWMYKGRTEEGIREEINSTLHCARLLRGHKLQSLAIPELSVLYTAIQLVAESERIEAPADKGCGMLPFEDCSSRLASSEVVLENLKGIAPAMEYIIDRHERAFKAAEQQRNLQASELECRATLEISEVPDASENPESYALDPYGNGDYFCKLCNEELSNIYMHCDGCEGILNKDYNICVGCHGDHRYKEFAQMHPSKKSKNSAVNHTGNNGRDVKGNKCPCKQGKACTRCGFCSGCSCRCHQCFTMHLRFSTMDEMLALRDRVRKVVGTFPIPTVLSGSSPGSKLPSASALALPSSATSGAALEMAMAGEFSAPDAFSGNQTSSREKRAKRRYRDSQLSSSSMDEEKKEDSSGVGDGALEAYAGGERNVLGRRKRKKSESSDDGILSEMASGGDLKVAEDAMKVDDEDGRKPPASRKRSRSDDDDQDTSNDGAIAKATQQSEDDNGVARSTSQSSAARSVRHDDNGRQKIIGVEDGKSAMLYRKIGSSQEKSSSPHKKQKGEDCSILSQGRPVAKAGSTTAPSEKKTQREKQSPTSKKTPPKSASSSSKKMRSGKVKRSCIITCCGKPSQSNSMCEEHYANSQAVDRKRPRDGRKLCPIEGCPRLADGPRHNGMCPSHYTKSKQRREREEIDESFEDPTSSVSDESEDEYDDTKLPAQQEDADPTDADNEETSIAAPIDEEEQPQLPSSEEDQQPAKPAASSRASGATATEIRQIAEQQGESQTIDSNDEEVEVIGKGAASTAPPAASNDPGRRSSSRASTRSSSRGTSAANTPTFEPNDKDDLIKKASQALIAPYNSSVTSMKSFPTQNGLTPAIVLQLLEDHENSDSDPSVGMLIAALPKECGLTRDDPDHRNMIRHLYRNFRGEDDLLQNKSGDKLSVSSQEKDLCVYALATMPLGKQFTFLRHFIPYRSEADVVKIYRYAEGKGLHHNKEHVAHVKRSIGLIERLEGPIETGEGGANDIDDR